MISIKYLPKWIICVSLIFCFSSCGDDKIVLDKNNLDNLKCEIEFGATFEKAIMYNHELWITNKAGAPLYDAQVVVDLIGSNGHAYSWSIVCNKWDSDTSRYFVWSADDTTWNPKSVRIRGICTMKVHTSNPFASDKEKKEINMEWSLM